MPHPLDHDTAQRWIERWDSAAGAHAGPGGQVHRADRRGRAGVGREGPLVIDLGCGPGSLSVRLLDRLPEATWSASTPTGDARAGPGRLGGRAGSLRRPWTCGWPDGPRLKLESKADAAVSTTALHWLRRRPLAALYARARRRAAARRPAARRRSPGRGRGDGPRRSSASAGSWWSARRRAPARTSSTETWAGWWEAARADPALAGPWPLNVGSARWSLDSEHHGSPSGLLSRSTSTTLRKAGFAEVGTLWQHGNNRILAGVLAP